MLTSLFMFPDGCNAAKTPELKFTRQIDLSDIGLSVKLMPDALATPLAPPTVYTYTYTEGNNSWKEEKYDHWELWHATQHGGRWIDQYTNSLILAKITVPYLDNVKSKHVSRARYDSLIKAVYSENVDWSDQELRDWVKNFTKANTVKSEAIASNTIKIKDLQKYYIDNNPLLLAYAFRLNPAAAGQKDADSSYYFCMVSLNNLADPQKSDRSLHSDFIKFIASASSSATPPSGPSNKFQVKPQNPSLLARRNEPEKSAEFIESRNQVTDSIKNMKDWWYVNTENYIILSNLSIKHKIMVQELQNDVEYYRAAYATLIKPRTDITAVSVIRVFASPAEYLAYVGADMQWTGGVWMPSKKEMAIKPIDWGGNKEQRYMAKRITFHEAFHQYLFYALDQVQTSTWFNEGHAEFFETAEIKNKCLEVDEDERNVEVLMRMIAASKADVGALVKMDREEFYSKNDEQRTENYVLAWALVYYLRKGASLDRPATHADLLDRYVDALWSTKDEQKATSAAFSNTNQYNFQNDFLKFWNSKTKRSAARRNKIFKPLAGSK